MPMRYYSTTLHFLCEQTGIGGDMSEPQLLKRGPTRLQQQIVYGCGVRISFSLTPHWLSPPIARA
jgi:hypothetical protein